MIFLIFVLLVALLAALRILGLITPGDDETLVFLCLGVLMIWSGVLIVQRMIQ